MNSAVEAQHHQWILWIVRASNGKPEEKEKQYTETGQLIYELITSVYATNEQHARQQAQPWLDRHPRHPYHSFEAHPAGFQLGSSTYLPGKITADSLEVPAPRNETR